MSQYPIVNLDAQVKASLIKHLKDHCGVEMSDSDSKAELIEAIITFEENNGIERPIDLMPEAMKPSAIVGATATLNPASPKNIPIAKHERKVVIITVNGDAKGRTQEFFGLNEWRATIKFGEQVDLPVPVIKMIQQAKEKRYTQEKDGSLKQISFPSYNIEFVGVV
ncbi:hypothetical protein [Vibrio litoralis]|uniref:hypothetical protein n=1 Tax=Vibrio litoralis TaxID=335972 RepID=UPI000408C84B|nr:hypothetical protein [Vibrio litoralis]